MDRRTVPNRSAVPFRAVGAVRRDRSQPGLEYGGLPRRGRYFRFIKRKRDRSRNITGDDDAGALRKSGGIQKIPVHGYEAALGLRAIQTGISGSVEGQL